MFVTSLTLLGLVSASPFASRWATDQAVCTDFYAPIQASSNVSNLAGIIDYPANQQVLVQASIDEYAAGSTVMQQIAMAPQLNISGTYTLWFHYCAPASGTPKGLFQTEHGIVGNAGYWDVRLPNGNDNLSFANAAAAAGWATLSYDRLGVGRSDHPDGINVVQVSYEVAQAITIAQSVRAGTLGNIGSFNTIIGVGHSYGSNLLTGVASVGPKAFDALVLTGFTNNATMGPLGTAGFDSTIASVAYPSRFSSLSNSYVITPSVFIDQQEFFHYPNFTNTSISYFTDNKGEYTLGQLNSIAGTLTLDRSNFTAPVLVVTGANDAPYCAGNCSVTSLGSNYTQLDTAKSLFPNAANFSTYVVPDTGHGINFHETAPLAYAQIVDFASSM